MYFEEGRVCICVCKNGKERKRKELSIIDGMVERSKNRKVRRQKAPMQGLAAIDPRGDLKELKVGKNRNFYQNEGGRKQRKQTILAPSEIKDL